MQGARAPAILQNADPTHRQSRWEQRLMKTEVELRHLRVFVTVAELGAYTRAARSLGISQSTVSETLSALERTLGTAVFRKVAKGSMLTPAGEALLPYARRMLALTSELVAELASVTTHVSATLVVTAVESLSTYVLPSRLADLRKRWPKARMELVTGTCNEIRESVAAGKCDLGLVLEVESGVEDHSILAKTRLVIVASPAHPFANRNASADQLRRCDFYMSDAAGDYHQVLRQYFESAQIPLPRTQALGTVEGVKRGILTGVTALGLLPAHAVDQELRDGVLAEVNVNPSLRGLAMRAILSPGVSSPPMVNDLIESLRLSPIRG
ncbi:MAG: LysR family transcriptional regulator [Dokdonella sp.]